MDSLVRGAARCCAAKKKEAYFQLLEATHAGIDDDSDLKVLLTKLAADAVWSYRRWKSFFDELVRRAAGGKVLANGSSTALIPHPAQLSSLLDWLNQQMASELEAKERLRRMGHDITDHRDRMYDFELELRQQYVKKVLAS